MQRILSAPITGRPAAREAELLKLEQGPSDEFETWRREADELTAIFTASFRTARSRR